MKMEDMNNRNQRIITNHEAREKKKKIEAYSKEKERRAQKPAFKFHIVGLKVGDTVVFDELNLPVTVEAVDMLHIVEYYYNEDK